MTDDDQDAASLRRSIFELGGTALLLGAWMGGLYWFTGLPDLARVPSWPGWEPFARMASSRTAPLDGVLQVAILVQWAIAAGLSAWLLISLLFELLQAYVALLKLPVQARLAVMCALLFQTCADARCE